jgi:hypothetical protein
MHMPAGATSLSASETPGQNSLTACGEIPFAKQFNYHLQDLPIMRQNLAPRIDGELVVHLPSYRSVRVDYNRHDPVEVFRERIQTSLPDIRVADYYVVSSNGIIRDGQSLDDFGLTHESHLLLIKRGVGKRVKLANRRFWLKSHESARRGEPRPSSVLSPPRKRPGHRVTPFRTLREAGAFTREHQ